MFSSTCKNALRTKNRFQQLTNYKVPFKKLFDAVLNFMFFTTIILVYCIFVGSDTARICCRFADNSDLFCYFFFFIFFTVEQTMGMQVSSSQRKIWQVHGVKMAHSKLKTPVLQVSFIISFLIPIRIQRRLKDTFSHVKKASTRCI